MEYTTETLEQKITIEGIRYTFDLVVSGYAKNEDDVNYTSFSNVNSSISNVTKYGKEINSELIELEIAYQIESDLEDILINNGY
tara:strand:+ start:157 stop:408 length:252 start_codon:yes stop_codon:yes gene_type:complete